MSKDDFRYTENVHKSYANAVYFYIRDLSIHEFGSTLSILKPTPKCISYVSCECDTITNKRSSRKEGFIWAQHSRTESNHGGEVKAAGAQAAGHKASPVKRARSNIISQFGYFLFNLA